MIVPSKSNSHNIFAVAFGSNADNDIKKNIESINTASKSFTEHFQILVSSSYYITSPTEYTQQNHFINTVALFTNSKPTNPFQTMNSKSDCHMVFTACQTIEKEMKSVKLINKGPRIIDLDIILFGGLLINEKVAGKKLQIPHASYSKRLFVLIPLAECEEKINTNLCHPSMGEATTKEIISEGMKNGKFAGQTIKKVSSTLLV